MIFTMIAKYCEAKMSKNAFSQSTNGTVNGCKYLKLQTCYCPLNLFPSFSSIFVICLLQQTPKVKVRSVQQPNVQI